MTRPLGYHVVDPVSSDTRESKHEMQALMDPIPVGKMSGESFSGDGSDGEKDGTTDMSGAPEH